MPAVTAKSAGFLLHASRKDKYWNLVKQLPSHNVATELVGSFFSEVNWYLTVLEQYYFDKLLTSWHDMSCALSEQADPKDLSRDLQYFPALLFQTLAMALQFLPPNTNSAETLQLKDPTACDRLSQKYSNLGLGIMALLGRHSSTIVAVQHDLMRAAWLKCFSRGTEAWYSLGNAIRLMLFPVRVRTKLTNEPRQAQGIGLHLQSEVRQAEGGDVEDTLVRLWYDEYKRRLWVTLFVWDRSGSATVEGCPC